MYTGKGSTGNSNYLLVRRKNKNIVLLLEINDVTKLLFSFITNQ